MHRRANLKLCEGENGISRSELAVLKPVWIGRVNPIRHTVVIDLVTEWFEANDHKIRDEFHAISHLGLRYIGLFNLKAKPMHDIEPILVVTNNNDGKSALEFHSGMAISDVNESIGFHQSFTVLKKIGFTPDEELKSLVNENLIRAKECFHVEYEREERFKKIKLTPENAHHLICTLLQTEIIAGRVAFELLTGWNKPEADYLKPRTLWSLFVHCLTFTNRLKSIQHIERSKSLHEFFDEIAGFHMRQTKWVQQTFA